MHDQQGEAIHLGDAAQRAALSDVDTTATEMSVPLEAALGTQLSTTWESIVARTQYPREVLDSPDGTGIRYAKVDGTYYYFGAARRSGFTHSPEPGSLLAEFVDLGDAVGNAAAAPQATQPALLSDAKRRAAALLARVARGESCVEPYTPKVHGGR